jgi:hypothetical protein
MRMSARYGRTQASAPRKQSARLAGLLLGLSYGVAAAIVGGVLLALAGLPADGWLAVTLMLLSVGAAGWVSARRVAGVGWKTGLLAGLLLALLTLIVSLVGGESFGIGGVAAVGGGCGAAGAIGGCLAQRFAPGRRNERQV